MKRIIAAIVLALASTSALPQQACVATPPIIPGTAGKWGVSDQNLLQARWNSAGEAVAGWARWANGNWPERGYSPAFAGCDTSKPDLPWSCTVPFAYHTEDGHGSSGTFQVSAETACPQGYSATGHYCIDNYTTAEGLEAAKRRIFYERDSKGNVLSIVDNSALPSGAAKVLARFGDYDDTGRPHSYDDGQAQVTITWPADASCLPTALSAFGWTAQLGLRDLDLVDGITVPYLSRSSDYDVTYYPDDSLHTVQRDVKLSQFLVIRHTWTYDQTGRLLAETNSSGAVAVAGVPKPPASTSAAVAPETAAALAPAAADPFFQPKVVVGARTAPGGPVGMRLLGPLTFLYPFFDLLGHQIVRMQGHIAANATAADAALKDKCDKQLLEDYATCEKFWTDRGLNPHNLPTNDLKSEHGECVKSAHGRNKACTTGGNLLSLKVPLYIGNQAVVNCYRQYAQDKLTCNQAALVKYPGGFQSPLPTLYSVDLYGCTLSADRRFQQCMAGQPLTPLEIPK